jgi:hypothetical protein
MQPVHKQLCYVYGFSHVKWRQEACCSRSKKLTVVTNKTKAENDKNAEAEEEEKSHGRTVLVTRTFTIPWTEEPEQVYQTST